MPAPRPRLEQRLSGAHDRFLIAGLAVQFAGEHGLPSEAQRRLADVVAEVARGELAHTLGQRLVAEIEPETKAVLITLEHEGPRHAGLRDARDAELWSQGAPAMPGSERYTLRAALGIIGRISDGLVMSHHGGGVRLVARIEPRRGR